LSLVPLSLEKAKAVSEHFADDFNSDPFSCDDDENDKAD
jgi:hypothetical protein